MVVTVPISDGWSHLAGMLFTSLCVLWSDYRKSPPGDFIRIRLKTEQNCRVSLDIVSDAIKNDLFMTFTSRLKADAKCVYQQWHCITVENYFGTSPVD